MVDKGYCVCKAYDLCEDIILLWNQVKNGTFRFPKEVTEETYIRYKKSLKPSAMRAFIGFGCSFGASWFSSYCAKFSPNSRNPVLEGKRAIDNMKPYIRKINELSCKSYDELEPIGYLIYCDPPYEGTYGYESVEKFDHKKFWNIMRKWSKHNVVVVSEFKAPKDFKCIWKKERILTANKNYNIKKTERLFIYSPNGNKPLPK